MAKSICRFLQVRTLDDLARLTEAEVNNRLAEIPHKNPERGLQDLMDETLMSRAHDNAVVTLWRGAVLDLQYRQKLDREIMMDILKNFFKFDSAKTYERQPWM